ncbi:amidohydrolase family protein [Sphingopyxis panaciterrulae]|uniref:Putative TIM-barrel fold metal-dependent hydrolase n=1 Tax=Sphingopyxis panaciterrulae TaxID=462372 RepID=A0A7W9B9Y0_9SPHN|nr:amidohydrolase family protein [Sphingopyxis panaciterrulae]MBB5708619.1 putative TIM-barrel fold metal-dependent hydrolase [Sphingopyxis panaciterrulae]
MTESQRDDMAARRAVTTVDAHQHFWTLSNPFTVWPPPDLASIHRDYGPDDLAPELALAGVDGTILVQAAPSVEESLYLLDIADRCDFVLGVVGWVDFTADDGIAQLDRLAASPWFKGVRPMLQNIDEPDWILRDRFAPLFDALLARGLRFDALIRPKQLSVIAELANRYPALPIVVDHGGKPSIADGEFTAWAEGIRALARMPLVSCKLSGIWTEAGSDISEPCIRPYVRHLLDCFGAGRLIWGSDWPVVQLAGSYQAWFSQCQAMLADLAPEDQAAVFGGNAMRFYGAADYAPTSGASLLLLHPKDNVLICTNGAKAGELVQIDGAGYPLTQDIGLGHKVARTALATGDKIYRYGVPIGTMTAPAQPGEHVHNHNLASDYLPAHGRDAIHAGEKKS